MTDVTEKSAPSSSDSEQTGQALGTPLPVKKAESGAAPTAEKVKPADNPAQPRDKSGKSKKGGGAVIAIIALVLVIGASAAGYTGWHRLQQQQLALEQRLTTEEQMLSGLQSTRQADVQTLQQQMNGLSESVAAAQQHDTRLDERLTDIDKRLEERRSNSWMVAEARYLINIANYQTQLNHNIKTALVALESADHRLRDMDDPSLLKARQIVTDNITTLRAITPVDIPGIALLLSQLEQQVATLPLLNPDEPQPAATAPASDSTKASAAEQFFSRVWNDIKGMVVIRHSSGPRSDATSSPDQRIYLQQNLRLKLETARLALLQRDTQTFQSTIATAQAWLNRYYDVRASSTSAMLNSLTPFTTLELQPALPDLSGALHILDSWQELHRNSARVDAPLHREPTPL